MKNTLFLFVCIILFCNACDNTKKATSSHDKKVKNPEPMSMSSATMPMKVDTIEGKVYARKKEQIKVIVQYILINKDSTVHRSQETYTDSSGSFRLFIPEKATDRQIIAMMISNKSVFSAPEKIEAGSHKKIAIQLEGIDGDYVATAQIHIGGDLGLANPGAKVNFMQFGVVINSFVADQNGKLYFTNLPNGMYDVEVSKPGFVTEKMTCEYMRPNTTQFVISLKRQ